MLGVAPFMAGEGCAGPGGRLPWMISMRFRIAVHWLSVSGARGELADGLLRAWVTSWRAATSMSVEEAVGIPT
jgi:hypothetical protein